MLQNLMFLCIWNKQLKKNIQYIHIVSVGTTCILKKYKHTHSSKQPTKETDFWDNKNCPTPKETNLQ